MKNYSVIFFSVIFAVVFCILAATPTALAAVTVTPATGGGLLDIVNGVATATISDTVAETVLLTLSDTQGTGLDVSSSQDVAFGVGALARYILNAPADFQAGNRAAYTVTRKDQYDNSVTAGNSTIFLYSTSDGTNKKFYDAASGGNVITSIVIPSGQSSVQFWYYDEKPGNWTITASDNSTTPDGATGINDGSDAISVTAGPTYGFYLNDPCAMTAGTRLGYSVLRKDAFGNSVTSGSRKITQITNPRVERGFVFEIL